jgi:pimeloyl-ACP methyl ester carboxylesterase
LIRIAADGDYGRAAVDVGANIDWSVHERDTLIDGRRVHYVDIGEGTSGFVCVHGMGGCWQHWSHTLPSLAAHGRATSLDLPGFGRSQMPARSITLDLLADTAATLAREVGLERVVFVGHSMGGPIALRFAARHPQLTESVVMLAGTVETFSALLGLRDVLRTARARPKDTAATYTEVLTCGLPLPGALKRAIARRGPLRLAALWPYVHRPNDLPLETAANILHGAGAPGALATARAISRSDPYAGLADVECPILSIGAAHDRIAPLADVEAFARIAPAATTVLLEGAGHMMMLERAAATNEQIERFVRGA